MVGFIKFTLKLNSRSIKTRFSGKEKGGCVKVCFFSSDALKDVKTGQGLQVA